MKLKLIMVVFICLILISCGHSIVSIKPVKIETDTKSKILMLPFDISKKTAFNSSSVYEYLSNELNIKLKEWLLETNGFEITFIKEIESLPFDAEYAYISNTSINKEMVNYAKENNYALIIQPIYQIDLTIDSSDTNKIFYINAGIIDYNIELNKINYNKTFSSVIGVDISLFKGSTSLIKDNENTNYDKNEEKELKIAQETIKGFSNVIGDLGNDYALFYYTTTTETEDDTTNDTNNTDDTTNNTDNNPNNNNGN